jgi:tetratricopeptide (TPR) repeat protein
MKKTALFFCFVSIIFSSCTTLRGDLSINSQRDQMERDLSKLEEAVVSLEAAGGAEARRRQSELSSVRKMIAELEKESAADSEYSAKLIAWSGRLAILEGRYSEAQRLYRQSVAVSAGNVPAIILGIRLEGDPEKRLTLIEKEIAITGQASSGGRAGAAGGGGSGFGELQIERARSLLEMNRFSEAAGAYDTAFASGLDNIYRDSYEKDRNRAWELRNTSGASAGTMNMLARDTVSWNDLINITRNETQLLRFISAGRNLSEAEFFNRLLERAFIPYVQDIAINEWPKTRPAASETVTRAGAAWFIWHLYAESRADRGLLSRYSARFATGTNPRSQIADVPPLSSFFDSILGCVETELLGLIDGRNFRPEQLIRGTEILATLKKID